MAAPFTWAPQPVGATSADDGGYTRNQSALYARIKLSGQVIGLAQNVRWEGQTGNRPVRGIGESGSENAPGDLIFTGTIGNMSIRKRRFIQLVQLIWPSVGANVDLRTLPFEVEVDFQFKSGSGATLFENNNEKLEGVWIQSWSAEFSDPNSLRMENLTFWASGWTMNDDGTVIATMGTIPSPVSTPAQGNASPAATTGASGGATTNAGGGGGLPRLT